MMLIKARTVAGDVAVGNGFIDRLQPWIYRRYVTRADIAGIRGLKRKLERLEATVEVSPADGIRDIQFCTQFLQLLNGGDLDSLRCQNTQRGLAALEAAKCLTPREYSLLEESYLWMRGVEHRREFGTLRATHEEAEFSQRREVVQQILNHLLEDAFPDGEQTAPETDLILDPTPSLEAARRIMSARGFTSPDLAYQNLAQLARERSLFLSTRRCRHFLAAIAPRLLEAISHTPDPDTTLSTLGRVADSLGGKGTLWELLSAIPATVQMFVRVCACSPYLSDLLIGNPGMIDELMDALILNRLPTEEELSVTAHDLCRGATDVLPILRQFKYSVHLQAGLREILGKSSIEETHSVLAATAETCLKLILDQELQRARTKLGVPKGADGTPLELVVIALGKLGGQEPNYHSDLELLFLYDEEEGVVDADRPSSATKLRRVATPFGSRPSPIPAHFFGQMAQNVVKLVNQTSSQGKLYEIDVRMRPTGSMATSLTSFAEHFQGPGAKLSDRQALLKSRPIYGSSTSQARTMRVLREIIQNTSWGPADSKSLVDSRWQAESNATSRNLKRSKGGTLDIEFLAQCLQMQHVKAHPTILVPGTLAALHQLEKEKVLDAASSRELRNGYLFLRRVESGLRLLNTPLRHDLPTEPRQLALLAYLLGEPSTASIAVATERIRTRNRELFLRLVNG
jgi:glutamate-ammonia-ligase adenylyltransferase